MNIKHFYDLKLKCPFCEGETKYNERVGFSTNLEISCSKLCHNNPLFLKLYISHENNNCYCSFFIYPNNSRGFRFINFGGSRINSPYLIDLEEENMLNLLYDYSINCDIKKIQQKYETLKLFQ